MKKNNYSGKKFSLSQTGRTILLLLLVSILFGLSGCPTPTNSDDSNKTEIQSTPVKIVILDAEGDEQITSNSEFYQKDTPITLSVKNLGQNRKVLISSKFSLFEDVIKENNDSFVFSLPNDKALPHTLYIYVLFAPIENHFVKVKIIDQTWKEHVFPYQPNLDNNTPFYFDEPHITSASPGSNVNLQVIVNYTKNQQVKLSSSQINFNRSVYKGKSDYLRIVPFVMPDKDVYIDAQFGPAEELPAYTCTLSKTGNNSNENITFSPAEPKPGDTVTITATIPCSHRQAKLNADGVTLQKTILTRCSATTTFVMPENNVNISAVFEARGTN